MRPMQGAHRRRRSYSSWDRRRHRHPGRTIAVVLAVVVLVVLVGGGILAGVRLSRPTPAATATVVLDGAVTVPGTAPRLPAPARGSTVVAIPDVGTLVSVHAATPVPLASITKLVAALVVLAHHPLSPGQSGPTLTVPASIAAAYPAEAAARDSVIPVHAGEHLSELQALEAMLIPSADNVAQMLATWTIGSKVAFVAAMNAEAAHLGLHHTHFADASGLSPASAGSAADMVHLASAVMAQPVLRAIVAEPQVTLPLSGLVYNYDYDLGKEGIVGIKTGSTAAAGGDFLFAARRPGPAGSVLVLGAVLGQQGAQPLQSALDAARRLAVAAPKALEHVTVLPKGRAVVRFHTAWGASATAVTTRAVQAWAVPGQRVELTVRRVDPPQPVTTLAPGTTVADVTVNLPTGRVTVPAVTTGGFSGPTLRWRLTHR